MSRAQQYLRRASAAGLAIALAVLAGCSDAPLSTLRPAGPGAHGITHIWWVMCIGFLIVWAFVVVLAMFAMLRRRRDGRAPMGWLLVGGGLVLPSVVVLALLVYGIQSGKSLLPLPTERTVHRIDVVAHQWWWEVIYPDAPGGPLYTANEIHIPVGEPVDFHVTSRDVIHSFWAPRLGGKMDAIPGRTNVIRLEADQPGEYRGTCAEFCGAQHARMGLVVIAHEPAELQARMTALARAGDDGQRTRDAAAFEANCLACHSVDPTRTSDQAGPNLADLGLRATLGAATMDNTPENLRDWLRHHQAYKPGNRMPTQPLTDEEVDSIAAYLESLP